MDKQKYIVVSAADKNFFSLVSGFEENVFRHLGIYPYIYDLGLEKNQRSLIKNLVHHEGALTNFDQHNSSGNIKATHKPNALLRCMDMHQKNILYLDVDTMLTACPDFSVFDSMDMCVTPRHPRELKNENWKNNGTLNSGVIFVANNSNGRELLEQWKMQCCTDQEATDQTALSEIIGEIDLIENFGVYQKNGKSIRTLNPLIYNDIACKTGDIFHFKNSGRQKRKHSRRNLALCIDKRFPIVMDWYKNIQRKKTFTR